MLYLYGDSVYDGERSDIEALLYTTNFFVPKDLLEVKVIRVTQEAITDIKALQKEFVIKREEAKNLHDKLQDLIGCKFYSQ